jgi:hypothetical protein
MNAIQARVAAIVATFIVTRLTMMGVTDLSPDSAAAIQKWVGHTFELMMMLGYAIAHPWLRKHFGEDV